MSEPRPNLAQIAALIGEPARAAILWALMDGTQRPASELARIAGLSPQSASQHMAKLVDGKLLAATSHGRHRYFRIAGPEAAHAIESLAAFSPPPAQKNGRRVSTELRHARSCYDHLAGELGIQVMRSLIENGVVVADGDGFDVTEAGEKRLLQIGIDVSVSRRKPRRFATACLDWTERSYHIGGALGAELLSRFVEMGWLVKIDGGRALRETQTGKRGFGALLKTKK